MIAGELRGEQETRPFRCVIAHGNDGERSDRSFIERFDSAIMRSGDEIVAFANIWTSGNGQELSVDLMRHRGAMPYGAMDFLFVELLERAQADGFARFNQGVAPLSGINGDRLPPA